MTTNGMETATETGPAVDRIPAWKRTFDNGASDGEYLSLHGVREPGSTEDFALAPLVDEIAYGIARGLVRAVKELQQHITSETRKVVDTVDRRLDTLQASIQELSGFAGEQRSANTVVQGQLEQLANADAGLRDADVRQLEELAAVRNHTVEFSAALTQKVDGSTASLREADARQSAELESLRTETRASAAAAIERLDAVAASDAQQAAGLAALQNETQVLSQSIVERIESVCRELGVHQEDINAGKTSLGTFYSRLDALMERLDRQADAVRSLHTAYSQRESELEQVVDGLARLRAFPAPLPSNGL